MSISSKIHDLVERIKIDPKGVQSEFEADVRFNKSFRHRLIHIKGSEYFDPESNKIFLVEGSRVTLKFTKNEENEINSRFPRA